MMEPIDRIAGTHVLLVEDNEINQMVVTELLEQAGARVSVAGNGFQCLDAVEQHQFEAVIMDIQMPEMDGYETTRKLRASGVDVPVIAMTAHAGDDVLEKCREAGMNDHVQKPVDPGTLYEKLLAWIALPENEPGVEEGGRSYGVSDVVTADSPPDQDVSLDIDGIDVRSGLQRVGGNQGLFTELLVSFKWKFSGFDEILRQLMDKGEDTAAQHQVHSLKGLAGNLGAAGLYHAADALEAHLAKGRKTGREALVSDLCETLGRVLAGIGRIEQAVQAEGAAASIFRDMSLDEETAVSLLKEVGKLLESDVAAAMENMDRLEPYFSGTGRSDRFETLKKHVFVFDTEEALAVLSDLLDDLSGHPGTPAAGR